MKQYLKYWCSPGYPSNALPGLVRVCWSCSRRRRCFWGHFFPKQAEDHRREKLKSLGFHVRVSFDSFHQFLDRESREPPPQGNYKDRWSKRSFFTLSNTDAFEVVYGRKTQNTFKDMYLSKYQSIGINE